MSSAGLIAWPFYLKKFNEVITRYSCKNILKTDCNNEANSLPKYGGLVKNLTSNNLNIELLEYDAEVINKALQLFPDLKIKQGDIRNLTYEDRIFDLVADFSTIDHIPEIDIYKALTEYLRITKNGGLILIVCWFSYNKDNVISNFDEWAPSQQYFLWEKDITDFLSRNSTEIIESEIIVNINYNNGLDKWRPITINPKYYLKYLLIRKNS